jgi:replication factor A1
MQIKDIKPKTGSIDIVGEIVDKSNVREFEKFGKQGKVCTAKIKDDTGEVSLTLWNNEADNISVGDKIHLTNGWAGEWQGEIQLSAGKFGKIEVTEKSGKKQESSEETTIEEEEI